jgi:predicted MFS family arabinose efflux permease
MSPEEQTHKTATEEWVANWPLVLSAMMGYSFVAAPAATLGLFMEPLQQAFGWSRSQVSAGLTVFSLVSIPLVPFAGALADRLGSRTVAVPGMAANALAFAAFALMTASPWHWFLNWTLFALTQLTSRSMVWNSAISSAFSISRGLALAVFMSSIAFAQTVAPILTRWLIDSYGWRAAYAVLGLGWAGLGFVMVLLFFHDHRSRNRGGRAATAATANPSALGGLTFKEAIRNPKVLRITLAIFLQTAAASGFTVHLVPLLGAYGVPRTDAAQTASIIGISALVGQLCTGWLVDRLRSTFLPFICFALAAIGYLLVLQSHGSEVLRTIGVLVVGYCIGAGINMGTYLASRYAGLAHFGAIFGLISSFMGFGAGVGPFVGGKFFDLTGNYHSFIVTGIIASLLAGLAVLRLGPYPEFQPVRSAHEAAG